MIVTLAVRSNQLRPIHQISELNIALDESVHRPSNTSQLLKRVDLHHMWEIYISNALTVFRLVLRCIIEDAKLRNIALIVKTVHHIRRHDLQFLFFFHGNDFCIGAQLQIDVSRL